MKSNNKDLIEAIQLTEEEVREAILEGKRKKFFKERNKDYWNEQEGITSNTRKEAISSYGNGREE